MARTISVSDELFSRIERLATPFVDKEPGDVILRLVESAEEGDRTGRSNRFGAAPITRRVVKSTRSPRERGVQVRLDGQNMSADSVRDLFDQILVRLSKDVRLDEIRKLMPYRTSSSRYLVAEQPTHPNGNPFVVPVHRYGIYMEAHKAYSTALAQIATLLAKVGVKLEYVV